MAQRYLYSEVNTSQTAKKGMSVCGDEVSVLREEHVTTVILCDGIGSGMNAHIAAALCKARLETLLEGDFSLQESFLSVARRMALWKEPGKPYAAFLIAQIRRDGYASVLGYEIPVPVWISGSQADVLPVHSFMEGQVSGWQANCYLRSGESLVFLSDGVTQAGLGAQFAQGWQSEGVADFVSLAMKEGARLDRIGERILEKAAAYDGDRRIDDMTAVTVCCRQGRTLNLITGPPGAKDRDEPLFRDFLASPGSKVICGATTAAIASRVLGRELKIETEASSLITPPKSFLDGVDLVTEGAITLNQLNNVLELPAEAFEEQNAVTELYELLMGVDRVHILLGTGKNTANDSVCFVQQGILSREDVVPLIVEKLRRKGKHVLVRKI